MDESEKKAFDDVQREMAELGIPVEPEEKTTVEPEVKPEEVETKEDEPKEVSVKEDKIDPKEYKSYKQTLREELQSDFDQKLEKLKEEMSKSKPNETKSEVLEEDVKALAKELDFDEAKTKRIIEVARKGLELSAEDKQALEEFKNFKTEREEKQQEEIFNEEWNTLPIKDQFPNASKEQLDKAKEIMDELSHSEKYHKMDMDYILFKEREKFNEALFSPRMKTFESGRLTSKDEESDELPDFNPDWTPAQVEKYEKQLSRISENLGKEKIMIRTTDDSGRVVEKWISQG